jgi:hypothetical protein
MAATFEYVEEAHEVRLHVVFGVGDGVAHTGLRGEMDHTVRLMLGEHLFDRGLVGEIGLHECEALARGELGKPRLLQRHVVISVHVVEADNLVTAVEQRAGSVKPDEAGSSGYEDFHASATRLVGGWAVMSARKCPCSECPL